MTRALLCALLLLTACQKNAPEGGLAYEGAFSLTDVEQGDTRPFELPAGARELFVVSEPGCAFEVTIKQWKGEAVARINGSGTERYMLQVPERGWYYASGEAGPGPCPTSLDLMK